MNRWITLAIIASVFIGLAVWLTLSARKFGLEQEQKKQKKIDPFKLKDYKKYLKE